MNKAVFCSNMDYIVDIVKENVENVNWYFLATNDKVQEGEQS